MYHSVYKYHFTGFCAHESGVILLLDPFYPVVLRLVKVSISVRAPYLVDTWCNLTTILGSTISCHILFFVHASGLIVRLMPAFCFEIIIVLLKRSLFCSRVACLLVLMWC